MGQEIKRADQLLWILAERLAREGKLSIRVAGVLPGRDGDWVFDVTGLDRQSRKLVIRQQAAMRDQYVLAND